MPANVTLCAPFRDSHSTLDAFLQCVERLDHPKDSLRIIAVEGDSTDDTYARLREWAKYRSYVTLYKFDCGKPRFPSVVNTDRFALLAKVFNVALDAVDKEWSDYMLFTPSDITFEPDVLSRLLAHQKDIIAPFYFRPDGTFYDTWGFTVNGKEMPSSRHIPIDYGTELWRMDTVGGMVLVSIDVLRAGCCYTREEVDRGLCRRARANGFEVWADPTTRIVHRG